MKKLVKCISFFTLLILMSPLHVYSSRVEYENKISEYKIAINSKSEKIGAAISELKLSKSSLKDDLSKLQKEDIIKLQKALKSENSKLIKDKKNLISIKKNLREVSNKAKKLRENESYEDYISCMENFIMLQDKMIEALKETNDHIKEFQDLIHK